MGIRQFMLTQIVDVITAYQKTGLAGVQQLDLTGRWDSTSEMFAYISYVSLLPSTLAELIGCSLSWGVVTRLRERRAIPAIVFLTNVLVSRLGLYRTPAVTEIEDICALASACIEPYDSIVGNEYHPYGGRLITSAKSLTVPETPGCPPCQRTALGPLPLYPAIRY